MVNGFLSVYYRWLLGDDAFRFLELVNKSQLLSNLLGGGVAGGLIFLYAHKLEDKIREEIRKAEAEKQLNSLGTELMHNIYLARKAIEKEQEYMKTDRILFADYKTNCMESFLYTRPLMADQAFYTTLDALTIMLEVDNQLLHSVRTKSDARVILPNKTQFFKNAKVVEKKLNDFFKKLEELTQIEGYYLFTAN
jgi:hypothetical protein